MSKKENSFTNIQLKEKLCKNLIEDIKKDTQNKKHLMDIPNYITDNLNKELREYQKMALLHFYKLQNLKDYYIDYYKDEEKFLNKNNNYTLNHLMFNMATGSGKTLVMAALMLELYKQGYRNFIFFVNSRSILEKTKANFCDESSSKYLFAREINIGENRLKINAVNNFTESEDNAINIHFATVQGLYSLFTNERENNLIFDDLKNQKIVLLADEAHHLNADTKKQTKAEQVEKDSWESIIQKAFSANTSNLLLEFTATIPNDKNVYYKYKNKIVYEYDLKSFCADGYSKRIYLMKYDDTDIKSRFLGACLSSLYRQLLAAKNDVALKKPVILFKSESIAKSNENQILFNDLIKNLQSKDIYDFYNIVNNSNSDSNSELLEYSLKFYENTFGESFADNIVTYLQTMFIEQFQLNANDDKQAEANQIKLNTLEDKENEIRVIFAVDKLNEGWDVLNLFDIVRLGGKANKNTTTKEAQLIGRGARYFPFTYQENSDANKYCRKFDNDATNELSMLERLSYHSHNEVSYITNLSNELKEQGILLENGDDTEIKVELTLSEKAKDIIINKQNSIYYVKNERQVRKNKKDLFNTTEILRKSKAIEIPLISNNISEVEELNNNNNNNKENYITQNNKLAEKISYKIFAKAMNILNISMQKLHNIFGKNTYKTKLDFYNYYIQQMDLVFNQKQRFDNAEINLKIAKYFLQNFLEITNQEKAVNYEVSDFQLKKLENPAKERIIYRNKNKVKQQHNYEWLYYTQYSFDSDLENDFLQFIENNKAKINNKFDYWFIIRNEGFAEFKIYNNNKNDNKNYAKGFEPDFIFFGKPKNENKNENKNETKNENKNETKNENKNDYLSTEIIMESKGKIFFDEWKEDLLTNNFNGSIKTLNSSEVKIFSLPFFLDSKGSENNFKNKFDELFSN